MSQIEAATSCIPWLALFALKLDCLQPQEEKCFSRGIIIRRLEVKTGLRCHLCPTSAGGRHGKSEPRSVGVLANAHGITLLLQRTKAPEPQLHQKLRWRLQSKGLLVSQWHSLPQGTGTFPAAYLGASSLCVCCVAMLVLPPKKLQIQCNIPSQKRTRSWLI